MELYASKTRRATNTQAIRALVRTIRRGGIRCGILFQTGNNKVFRIRNTLLPSSKPTRSDGYKLFIGITLEIARSGQRFQPQADVAVQKLRIPLVEREVGVRSELEAAQRRETIAQVVRHHAFRLIIQQPVRRALVPRG